MIETCGNSRWCVACDEDLELPDESNPEALLIAVQTFEEQHRACDKRLLAQMEDQMKNTSECRGQL